MQYLCKFVVSCGMLMYLGCGSGESTPSSNEESNVAEAPQEPDTSESEPATSSSISEKIAPEDVKLTKLSWEEVMNEVAQHEGKVVVLDVWSTSCQPCLREFPNLVLLQENYPEKVVCLSCSTDYVGISTKPPEYYEEGVRKFLSSQNAKFDNYLCTEPADEIFLQIDLASIPAVYVFGTDGQLVERFDNDAQKYGDEFTYEDHIIPKVEMILSAAE